MRSLLVLALLCLALWGQGSVTIFVTVRDSSAAVAPQAEVAVRMPVTDASGVYTFSALPNELFSLARRTISPNSAGLRSRSCFSLFLRLRVRRYSPTMFARISIQRPRRWQITQTPVRSASLLPARRLTTLMAAVPLPTVATYARHEHCSAYPMTALVLMHQTPRDSLDRTCLGFCLRIDAKGSQDATIRREVARRRPGCRTAAAV
jgi:hypothetical protein